MIESFLNSQNSGFLAEQVAEALALHIEETRDTLKALALAGKIICEGDLYLSKRLVMARLEIA